MYFYLVIPNNVIVNVLLSLLLAMLIMVKMRTLETEKTLYLRSLS